MKSAAGATLTLEPDNSIFVSGEPPGQRDLYARFPRHPQGYQSDSPGGPADDRLPSGGPGTHSSGNFVLSDLTVSRRAKQIRWR